MPRDPTEFDALVERLHSRDGVTEIRIPRRAPGAPAYVCVMRGDRPAWWCASSVTAALELADAALQPKVVVEETVHGFVTLGEQLP